MPFRPKDLAQRQEAFRRLAPNRKATTFGPEFDRAFAVWDAKRRIKKLMVSLAVVIAAATVGGALFARAASVTAQGRCTNAGGQWTDGHCDGVD